ncbi:MAG TPA: hypothetical protein VLJ11_10535 [Bryobacteraceae bacterium]|nr:hypothetical protein [Bryobacteraceae bacterium]
MWNSDALTIPKFSFPQATYTLSGDVAGMKLVCTGDGAAQLGPVLRLPKGASIEAFGAGFNERTFKVRYQGSFYFVFSADLEANSLIMAVGKGN